MCVRWRLWLGGWYTAPKLPGLANSRNLGGNFEALFGFGVLICEAIVGEGYEPGEGGSCVDPLGGCGAEEGGEGPGEGNDNLAEEKLKVKEVFLQRR